MNINPKHIAYVVIGSMFTVGGFFSGIRPVMAFELAAVNDKIDQFACLQVVMKYVEAVKAGDAEMIAYWSQQAAVFACTLPPIS